MIRRRLSADQGHGVPWARLRRQQQARNAWRTTGSDLEDSLEQGYPPLAGSDDDHDFEDELNARSWWDDEEEEEEVAAYPDVLEGRHHNGVLEDIEDAEVHVCNNIGVAARVGASAVEVPTPSACASTSVLASVSAPTFTLGEQILLGAALASRHAVSEWEDMMDAIRDEQLDNETESSDEEEGHESDPQSDDGYSDGHHHELTRRGLY